MIYDLDKILDRWYEYGKQLYSKDSLNVRATTNDKPNEQESEVLLSEIRQAIKRLKNNKAPGLDNIPAELLKAGGETTVMSLKAIIDQIWETGEWPDEWVMSELITLPKVTGTFECDKHRTISRISHAAKIALESSVCVLIISLPLKLPKNSLVLFPAKGRRMRSLCCVTLLRKL